MYRAILMGLFLSACTDEPGVGVNRYHGDSKPVREHEIQTGPEALAVAGELVTLVREASTGTALRGVDGSASVSGTTVGFEDFVLRLRGGDMTLAGEVAYRHDASGQLALDGVVDVQWSEISDTVTLHDRTLTTASGKTFAF